jgi:hypothetical protein
MHDVLLVVLTAGASAVAAWWGGKLGVQRDAEKLAQARAFDRRLDWYERATRALQRYKIEHTRYLDSISRADRTAAERHYLSVVNCFREIAPTLQECILYGTPATLSVFLDVL